MSALLAARQTGTPGETRTLNVQVKSLLCYQLHYGRIETGGSVGIRTLVGFLRRIKSPILLATQSHSQDTNLGASMHLKLVGSTFAFYLFSFHCSLLV